MNEFISLPLTAAQVTNGQMNIDPDFSVMQPANGIDPGFSVIPQPDDIDPGFSVMPQPDDIDPDFSVVPPVYPIDPDFSVMPPVYPVIRPNTPCLFCNNTQWIRGAIRLLNAVAGYQAFTVFIDGRPVARNFNFPEITQYRQLAQGYHVFTVMGNNGYTYVRKSMYVGDGMATVAIINAPAGLDLTMIADTTCPAGSNSACFRVCNLAYFSGPVNASIGNVYFNAVNFNTAASFSSIRSGNYTLNVSRSARPENTLVSTPVTLNRRRIYTAYVLNWNPSPDTIQTLLVEDRRG